MIPTRRREELLGVSNGFDLNHWFRILSNRRRSRRRKISSLCAMYWNGSVAISREVTDINFEGASIETSDRWYLGTVLSLHLLLVRDSQSGEDVGKQGISFGLWAKVVRQMPSGMCVEFIHSSPKDRRDFRRFMAAAEKRH